MANPNIEYKQGGYQAWKNEYAIRRPSWMPIIIILVIVTHIPQAKFGDYIISGHEY